MNNFLLIVKVFLLLTITPLVAQTNWSAQESNTFQSLRSVSFTSSNSGWAVGFNGTILRTNDGGNNWIAQLSGTTNKLFSVIHFNNPSHGWVAGEFGTILHTQDGGNTWGFQNSGVNELLTSIQTVGSERGFIAGNNGTMLKTVDSGLNWVLLTTNTTEKLNAISFIDQLQGWAVGFNGIIIKTSDGGNNWQTQSSGTVQELNSIVFLDSNIGWIAGNSGTILKTSDGGVNWLPQTSGTTFDLNSVFFSNESLGWITGVNGTLLFTNDGGSSWQPVPSNVTNNLYSIYFINPNLGWVVGDSGTILKHTVRVTISPQSQTVNNNDPISIQVGINEVQGLFAASITLEFDNSIIVCQNISNGSFLESNLPGYDVFFETYPQNLSTTDSVIVDQSILGISSVSGTGNIFNIQFIPIRSGTTKVKIKSVRLRDLENQEIAAQPDTAEIIINSVVVNTKVFLEGAFNTGTMSTILNSNGYLPTSQPYNVSPWNYNGIESVSVDFFPSNSGIVDWILIELRTGTSPSSIISTRAAFLLSNGQIVDIDGVSPVSFFVSEATEYYLVIKHRNHLSIMSYNSIQLNANTPLYNFTNSQTKAFGINPMIDLGGGIFGMYSGDANADDQVNATDRALVWNLRNSIGYFSEDFNLDGQVNAADRATAWNNRNIISQTP